MKYNQLSHGVTEQTDVFIMHGLLSRCEDKLSCNESTYNDPQLISDVRQEQDIVMI